MKTSDLKIRHVDREELAYWAAALISVLFFVLRNGSIRYAVGALCLFAVLLLLPGVKRVASARLFPWFWCVLFVCGSAFSIVKYLTFNDIGDVDFSCYTSVLSNTLHGNILFHSFLQQNLLAIHSSAAILLFFPFYLVMGNIGLLIAQAACWCIGVYLIVRSNKAYPDIPLILVIAVACSAYLVPGIFYGFHPDILVVPGIGLLMYSYQYRKFIFYICAILLLFTTKEIFILIPCLFSVIAILEKRKWHWTVVPPTASIAYALLYWFVIAAYFQHGHAYTFNYLIPHSFAAILHQFLSIDVMLFIINATLLYLPYTLINPRYLLLPLSYIVLYAVFPDNSFRDSWRHYVLVIGALSLIPIVKADQEKLKKLVLPALFITLCAYPQWRCLVRIENRDTDQIRKTHALINRIPPESFLVAHGPFMACAAKHTRIENWIYKSEKWSQADYLLMDKSFQPGWWIEGKYLGKTIDSLESCGNWKAIGRAGSVILLQNKEKG